MAAIAMILGGIAGFLAAMVALLLGAHWAIALAVWSLAGGAVSVALLFGFQAPDMREKTGFSAKHA